MSPVNVSGALSGALYGVLPVSWTRTITRFLLKTTIKLLWNVPQLARSLFMDQELKALLDEVSGPVSEVWAEIKTQNAHRRALETAIMEQATKADPETMLKLFTQLSETHVTEGTKQLRAVAGIVDSYCDAVARVMTRD